MSNSGRSFFADTSSLQWIVYLLLGSTTLVITVNSYDSGIAKTPLLVLSSSLLVATFLAESIRRGKMKFQRSSNDFPVLVFLLLILASVFYSKNQWTSVQALKIWIPFLGCFFAGTQLFPKRTDVDKLMRILALFASAVCIVGILQFFFADKLFLNFFIGEDRRVASTLTNATYLSGYIVLLFPVLLALTVNARARTWKRWSQAILLGGLAFVLFVTSTRTSIAAFLLSLILFAALSRRKPRQILIWGTVAIAVAASAVYLSPRLVERIEKSFSTDASSSFARRMYFWEAGYNAFKAAPFFGHGIGSYGEVMREFRSPDYWIVKSEDVVPHAHNELVETAVDLGGVGLVVYLTTIATALFVGFRSQVKEKEADRLMRVGLICSFLAILFDNLANISLRVAPVGAIAWLFLGILASQSSGNFAGSAMRLRLPKWSPLLPLAGWGVFAYWFASGELDVYRADGHMITAMMAAQSKKLPTAISEYQHAIALDPNNLLARSNLTLTLLMAGQDKEAMEVAQQLQGLSPTYPKSNLMQAAALVTLKRYAEALRSLEKELEQCSHPAAYLYQAAAYMGLGNSAAEKAALEHLLLADLKGHFEYELKFVSERLLQLVRTEEDVLRFREVYTQLSTEFPSNEVIFATLAKLGSRLTTSRGR